MGIYKENEKTIDLCEEIITLNRVDEVFSDRGITGYRLLGTKIEAARSVHPSLVHGYYVWKKKMTVAFTELLRVYKKKGRKAAQQYIIKLYKPIDEGYRKNNSDPFFQAGYFEKMKSLLLGIYNKRGQVRLILGHDHPRNHECEFSLSFEYGISQVMVSSSSKNSELDAALSQLGLVIRRGDTVILTISIP